MKTAATIKPETELQGEPQVRSSEWLGRIVEAGETWAILADGKIMDVCPSAETAVAWLAGRIGMDDAGTRHFMELNGWKLVRVQTSYKVMAVLETQYQMRPNAKGEAQPPAKNYEYTKRLSGRLLSSTALFGGFRQAHP